MSSHETAVIDCDGKQLARLLDDFLADNKSVYCRFRGESMLPTIRDGEVVKIEPIKKAFKRNDVLVFKDRTNSAVSHRLIKITGDGKEKAYLFCADNSSGQLDTIRREDILGKVTAIRSEDKEMNMETMWGRKAGYMVQRFKRTLYLLKQKLPTVR